MRSHDQHLKNVFKEPPLVAFKKQKNLKDLLIRAKVPGPIKERSKKKLKGMFKCNQEKCTSCPYIKEGKTIKINKTTTWQHNKKFTCNTSNVVYLIECKKETCQKRYIGQTGRPLRSRLADHCGYVVNEHDNIATGAHFTSLGHSLSDLTITILE